MTELFTLENLFTLLMLVMLQAVLGFDNLLYISLESKAAPKEKQNYVRTLGISLAIILRIVLLVVLVKLMVYFQNPIWEPHYEWFKGYINIHSLIVLFGGAFIIYTAIKEIWHMVSLQKDKIGEIQQKSVGSIITMIVIMNLVFSFDSILSAMALVGVAGSTEYSFVQLTIMTAAIVISGILMIVMSKKVAEFLHKNRMYEVLGLFVLFIVGIMLVTEGGHLAHLEFFGNQIQAMSKTTFYFVLVILIIVDLVQGRYQKKIAMEQEELGKII
jgi:predicted tellurium resistance membrane protein TerC